MNHGSDSVWHLYILKCGDGSFYTGISTDVEARLKKHNAGKGAAYTRSHLPVVLVWSEEVGSESEAKKREAEVKKLNRKEKIERFGLLGDLKNES